ncbi:MAG: tyrosine-type recombinase/integrase [Flavobacteriaceae bacterium]|nr:MAG: tyrosine-type recombinase/integrase [Flavobacteriaceae bacterium]QMU66260.1 MAG: tyrosine-type recombinase/integrase [Flavobacteriaceae bacterium]
MITLHNYLKNKYSKSTLKSNLYNIKKFTDYYGKRSEKANYKEVLNYIAYLRKNYDLSPKTLRHRLYAVKIYFNYLLEVGKRKDHPCSELFLKDKIDRTIAVDNLYSPEALENFFKNYKIKKKKQLLNRNKIIISLLIYQGLTVKEIAELQLQSINLNTCEIHIKSGYRQQKRTLPLQAKQVLLFFNYLEKDRKKLLKYNLKTTNETFILGQYGNEINPHSISRIINQNRNESQKIKPIKIRQSVIANLLKKENDTRLVQVFSGHKRASTTIAYKQTELEQLQNAIENYHPIS